MANYDQDVRTKVDVETLSLIQAIQIATDTTQAELVRGWIMAAAKAELHKANIICRVMRVEGSDGAKEGTP